jgi:hypothetical protein
MRNITIKKTNLFDSQIFFTVRNNKKNRKNSLNIHKIKINDHNEWFKKNYNNKYYFTCFEGNTRIGYVRGDLVGDTNVISIAFDIKNQNKNIGTQCLKLFEKKINENCIFIAKVKKKNNLSSRFFEKNGFCVLNSKRNMTTYYKIKNNLSSSYLKIINEIENVRKKNNSNWMDVLRIAFKNSPKETSKVFKEINDSDGIINKLTKKLC